MSDTRIKSNIKKQERNSYTPVLISFRDKPNLTYLLYGKEHLESHFNRIYKSVLIESHPVDTSHTVVASIVVQRAAMVDDIIIFSIRNMQYGMMPGSSRDCRILLENRGDTIERSERRIGNRISDTIIGTCPAPLRST